MKSFGLSESSRWNAKLRLVVNLVIVLIFATIYLVMQQTLRLEANQQPLRITSQMQSNWINSQIMDTSFLPKVELDNSAYAFAAVFNEKGEILSTNATFKASDLDIPTGVLSTARNNGLDKVTWQPDATHRFAIVAMAQANNVFVAGQSLRPTEDLTNQLGKLIGGAMVVTILFANFALLLLRRRSSE